jgi:hypothetical protein
MSERETKSEVIYVRVTPDTKKRLSEEAVHFKMHYSDLVRELVTAFIEGRVTVTPPQHVKEFYNVTRSED